jgi:hypothetical protein
MQQQQLKLEEGLEIGDRGAAPYATRVQTPADQTQKTYKKAKRKKRKKRQRVERSYQTNGSQQVAFWRRRRSKF